MRAILIDPERRIVTKITLKSENEHGQRDEMAKIIGCGGMDYTLLSDMLDSLWVDQFGLARRKPTYAFKLRIRHDPFAGRALVIGTTADGKTCEPRFPLDLMRHEITWLGLIVPEVDWIEEGNRMRAVVTYRRAP
jgi:hypothetical protein